MSTHAARIKAYGLVEFTKSGYVKTQAVVLHRVAVLVGFGFLWQPPGVWATNLFSGHLG